MSYTKINWASQPITPENLNHMQTQYAAAVADATGIRSDHTLGLTFEVVADFPAHAMGRMVFHSGYKMFFYSNGSEWLMEPAKCFYGDGRHGIYSSDANLQFTNGLGDTIIKNYQSFTLNDGHTLSIQQPCRVMVIRSWGDIVINGTIDLDYMGGYGGAAFERYVKLNGINYLITGGKGGNGGGPNGGTIDLGEVNYGGGLRGGGGGGGAGLVYYAEGGQPGYLFSVGGPQAAGGSYQWGGAVDNLPQHGTHGVGGGGNVYIASSGAGSMVVGGAGAATTGGRAATGGGGGCRASGVPAYETVFGGDSPSTDPLKGGGGALVLLALGNITIGSTGVILARGAPGGAGGNAYSGTYAVGGTGGGGGGGSGGGRVVVIRKGTYTNTGTVAVNGGAGGLGGLDYTGSGIANPGDPGVNGSLAAYAL